MAMRPCNQPGCRELVTKGYCKEHYREPKPFKTLDNKKTDADRKFYSSAAWTRVSKLFRASHPLCERCKERGIVTAATLVHHDPDYHQLIADNRNPLSWRYLHSLCNMCHLEDLRSKRNRQT
jgi:5-methylcytosine-specific restriction protein A